MSDGTDIDKTLRAALLPHGLFLRGVIAFDADFAGPVLAAGGSAQAIALIGPIGGSLWAPFSQWRQSAGTDHGLDPLDDWSKEVLRPLAGSIGAEAFFPSDPPWQPFQRWASRAEGLRASPLGILTHPQFGLWHGYRGALAFSHRIDERAVVVTAAHPCDRCQETPCLSHCPVGAITANQFDVRACRAHLATAQGRDCLTRGCLARNACPVGTDYRYPPEQLQFHMAALKL